MIGILSILLIAVTIIICGKNRLILSAKYKFWILLKELIIDKE